MAKVKFNTVVSRLKTAIRNRAKKGFKTVSAVDVAHIMRKASTSSSRGAAVRRAFTDLVEEGVLATTNKTQYNSDTHHSVTVYRVR